MIRASISEAGAQGGWFAAPDPAGYRAFTGRYRTRYGRIRRARNARL